jgi:hypothetical protein
MHGDDQLAAMVGAVRAARADGGDVIGAAEGMTFDV